MLRSDVYQKYFLALVRDSYFFAISHGSVVIPSTKIATDLFNRTYEKLYSKGEPYHFGGWQDPLLQTDKQN